MAKVSPPSIYVVPVNPAMLAKAVGLLAGLESAKMVGTQSPNLGVLDPSGVAFKGLAVTPADPGSPPGTAPNTVRLGGTVLPGGLQRDGKFIQALIKLKLEMLQRADQIRIAPRLAGGGWPFAQIGTIEGKPLYLISTGTYNQAEGLKLVGTHRDVDISSGRAADRLLLQLALEQAPPSSVSIGLILPEEETVKGEVMFGSEDRQNLDGLTIPGFPARLSRGLGMAVMSLPDPNLSQKRKQKEILDRLKEKGQVLRPLYIPAEAFAGIFLTPAGQMEHERLGHREKILDFLVGGPGKLPKGKLERLAEEYGSYPKLFAFLQSPRLQKLLATGSDLREAPAKGWKPIEVDPVALTDMVKSANQGDTFFTLEKYEDDPKSWGKAKGAVLPRRPYGGSLQLMSAIPKAVIKRVSIALVGQPTGPGGWQLLPERLSLNVLRTADIPDVPNLGARLFEDVVAGYEKDDDGKLDSGYLNRGEPFLSILAVVDAKDPRVKNLLPVKRADFIPKSRNLKLVFLSNIEEDQGRAEVVGAVDIQRLLNSVHGQRMSPDGQFISHPFPFPFSAEEMVKIPWVKKDVEEGDSPVEASMNFLKGAFRGSRPAKIVIAGRFAQAEYGARHARGKRIGGGRIVGRTPQHVVTAMPVSFRRWLPITQRIIREEGFRPEFGPREKEIREAMIRRSLELYGLGSLEENDQGKPLNRKQKLKKLEDLKEKLESEGLEETAISPFPRSYPPSEEGDWIEFDSATAQLNPDSRPRKPRKARRKRRSRRSRYNPGDEYGIGLGDYLKGKKEAPKEVEGLEEGDVIDWTRTPTLFPTSRKQLPGEGLTALKMKPGAIAGRVTKDPFVRWADRPVVPKGEMPSVADEGLSREEFSSIVGAMERSRKSRSKTTIPASSSMCKVYRRQKLPGYRLPPALIKAGHEDFNLRKVVIWQAPEGTDDRIMMVRRNTHIDCDFTPSGDVRSPGQVLAMAIQDVLLWLGQKEKRRQDTFVYVGRIGNPELKVLWTRGSPLTMETVVMNLQAGATKPLKGYDEERDEANYRAALSRAGFAARPSEREEEEEEGLFSEPEGKTVRELRALAKERGISGYSKMKKAELVQRLSPQEEEEEEEELYFE